MNLRDLWKWLKAEFRWRVLGKRYEVILTEEAKMQLDELPEEAQAEIRKAMERIGRNPYTSDRMETEEVTALRIASFLLVNVCPYCRLSDVILSAGESTYTLLETGKE